MKKNKEIMQMVFPSNQLFQYLRNGKFIALSADWKHAKMGLQFDYELIVVTEGVLYLRYMDEEFTVRSGEYLILPPSNSNREGFKRDYCAFYWIHFIVNTGAFPARINTSDIKSCQRANCFTMPQKAAVPQPAKLVVQMKQLQDLDRNKYPSISLNAAVTAILTELYGQLQAEKNESDPLGSKQIYSDIADYIRINISENLKTTDIADAFGYSPKYLSHLFSEVRGISLKQFIMSQKIDTACYYLTDSDKNITVIASELGFSDVHNFSRAFKKSTGLTPSAYRNTYAKRLLYHV
jgi:AraC-like DNA-binding protein